MGKTIPATPAAAGIRRYGRPGRVIHDEGLEPLHLAANWCLANICKSCVNDQFEAPLHYFTGAGYIPLGMANGARYRCPITPTWTQVSCDILVQADGDGEIYVYSRSGSNMWTVVAAAKAWLGIVTLDVSDVGVEEFYYEIIPDAGVEIDVAAVVIAEVPLAAL